MKEIISAIAIILSFIGYVPYIRDTLKGKTHPHTYSWVIWSLITFTAFALQLSAGAGPGAIVTLAAGLVTLIITILSFRVGNKDIKNSDKVFFTLALISIILWIVTKEPIASTLLLSITSFLGFVPTLRKAWNKPEGETLFTWELNTLRHFLSVLAIQNYNIATTLYPATWVLINGLFSIILIVRRRYFKSIKKDI